MLVFDTPLVQCSTAIDIEAVLVPGEVHAGSVLVAAAALSADWGFTPVGGPQDQSAGMLRGVACGAARVS